MNQVQKLKKELVAAIVSLMIAAVALSSATYAWFISNSTVTGTTSTISATTNGFILQIAKLEEGAQHGGEQKSLEPLFRYYFLVRFFLFCYAIFARDFTEEGRNVL